MERPSALEVYTEVVLPALQERLDSALPEFGWRRDRWGWVATDQEFTHRVLGVRADRVVAHGSAPTGFLVHGGDSVLWTAYLNGGVVPRGLEFVRTVEELARRVGLDPGLLERRRPRDRRCELLQAVFVLAEAELRGERGENARAYLQGRGFPPGAIEHCGLGLFPDRRFLTVALERHGYTAAEVNASGVLADWRWPGRIVGCWRDKHGNARTLWARSISQRQREGSRYLYLRGASRAGLPPYGFSSLLDGSLDRRRELVLVEGVIDVHALRSHGVENICALGGTSIRSAMFEQLANLGVEKVTLCLDNDRPGRTATVGAIEQAAQAPASPALFVVDPAQLAPAKDPDAYLRAHGANAFAELLTSRLCAVTWRALEFTRDLRSFSTQEARRAALACAGGWLGRLPSRLTLEQEDAIHAVADRCGYTAQAIERAFRAQYWQPPERPQTRERHNARAIAHER
jgi:DNA primase